MSNINPDPFTTRPEIEGMFGVVTSTHWIATAVGMATLEKGGNAFDAGVATAFTLQVVEPHLNGPGGDVPADTGVCTDEIIRSYRAVGVDLQKEVHEDMVENFAAYPNKRRWLLSRPDSNIDHRRVPNLMVFFTRKGESLPITSRAQDYLPGDLETWDLGGGVPHIGIVVDQKSSSSGRYHVVHNIGAGPKMEDVLFNWKITGHYRYFGPKQ
mgnify:CR=1 FL=1